MKSTFAYYTLDIETKPDEKSLEIFMRSKIEIAQKKLQKDLEKAKEYKKPETIAKYAELANKDYVEATKPEKYRKAMALDSDFSKIFCIGLKEYGEEGTTLTLEEFASFLVDAEKNNRYITFITFNGKKFDLPIIIKDGLKNKLEMPYKVLKANTQRFKQSNEYIQHIDLFEELGQATGDWKSLSLYSEIYLGRKKENDGDDFFETATDDDIKARCIEDLTLTEDLFNIFTPIL
ncbi:MAG: hypothetical protein DRI86_07420 [Bacteroidetes bacterium]|nr:MAG: hypothetical protein DRI86_07420 [Bacteroidota bacterium]